MELAFLVHTGKRRLAKYTRPTMLTLTATWCLDAILGVPRAAKKSDLPNALVRQAELVRPRG